MQVEEFAMAAAREASAMLLELRSADRFSEGTTARPGRYLTPDRMKARAISPLGPMSALTP